MIEKMVVCDSIQKLLRVSHSLYQQGHETLLTAVVYERYV